MSAENALIGKVGEVGMKEYIVQAIAQETIDSFDAHDAPELVRCRDCKYWSAERINDYNKCRRWIKVGVKNFATTGDWFCADGERK